MYLETIDVGLSLQGDRGLKLDTAFRLNLKKGDWYIQIYNDGEKYSEVNMNIKRDGLRDRTNLSSGDAYIIITSRQTII